MALAMSLGLQGIAQTALPYKQTFDTPTAFGSFTVVDANADGYTWKHDSFDYEAACERNMFGDADDWLITPVFHFAAGTSYTVAFDAHTRYGGNDEVFDVCLGTEAAPAAMTQVLMEGQRVADNYPLKHFEQTFTVEAEGDYYLAVHHKTVGETYGNDLCLDNLEVKAQEVVAETSKPGPVTDLTLTVDYDTNLVKLKWKAPTQTVDGKPLDPSTLTYTVTQLGSSVPTATDFPGTTYREELRLSDLKNFYFGQGLVRYIVVAKDAQGEVSEKAYSNYKVVGTPYPIPYEESFAEGNAASFWGESHEGIGRWLPMQAANTYVQDGDGGMYCFTAVESGDDAVGFSGLIDLGKAENPVLSFWYFYTTAASNELDVLVATDTKDFEVVQSLDTRSNETYRTWNHIVIPLAAYADSRFIQVAFRNRTTSATSIVYVDNLKVFNQVERDLGISVVGLPVNLRPDEPRQATVRVRNNGMKEYAQADYQVEFVGNGLVLGRVDGEPLVSGQEVDMDIPVEIPLTLESDSIDVFVRVVSDGDECLPNDASEPTRMRLIRPDLPRPTNLTAEASGAAINLTWQKPAEPRSEGRFVTDSFEDAPDFTISNWGDWLLFDESGYAVYGIDQYEFPNMGMPQAFTVLNPAAAGMSTGWSAHSGQKLLAAFASGIGPIDHWLISPELSRAPQTIRFFAKAYSANYAESFEVLSSSESIDRSTFRQLASHTTAKNDTEWQEYSVDLPEGSKYFAIRAVSDDTFALLIDDVTFMPDTCGVQHIQLQGYNVYRDGVKLNSDPVGQASFTDSNVDGTHSYRVTAVYDTAESGASNEASTTADGITFVPAGAEADADAPLYDLLGRRVSHVRPGIYLRGSRKVIITH